MTGKTLWDLFAEEEQGPTHACGGDSCQVCKMDVHPPTPAKHLARTEGPATSASAAADLPVTDLEALVLHAVREAGADGMTQDELLQRFSHLSYSSVTARPAALKARGLIADSGMRRKGRSGRSQTVLVAVEYLPEEGSE